MVRAGHNPYEAPASREPLREEGVEWSRALKVLAGCVIGLSTLATLASALHVGYALRAFSAQARIAALVTVAAFREDGAHATAAAAALGAFVGVHQRTRSTRWETAYASAPLFVAIPCIAVLTAHVMAAAAVAIVSLAFDVPTSSSWASIRELLRVDDVYVGVGKACAFAAAAALVTAWLAPIVARTRARPAVKLLVMLIAARMATSLLDLSAGALPL